MKKIKNAARLYIVPVLSLAVAFIFWLSYGRGSYGWWIIAIILITVVHFRLYFRGKKNNNDPNLHGELLF